MDHQRGANGITREDLGFLMSRCLAVLGAFRLIQMLMVVPSIVAGAKYAEDYIQVWLMIPPYLSFGIICIFLWVRADSFGRCFGKGEPPGTISFPGDLRGAIFGGIGLYFLLSGAVRLLDFWLRESIEEKPIFAYAGYHHLEWVLYLFEFVAGALILLQSARPGWLRKLAVAFLGFA